MHSHPSASHLTAAYHSSGHRPRTRHLSDEWKKSLHYRLAAKHIKRRRQGTWLTSYFYVSSEEKKYLWLGLELQFISGKHSEFCRHPRSHTVPLVDDILVQNKSIVTEVPQMNQDISKKTSQKAINYYTVFWCWRSSLSTNTPEVNLSPDLLVADWGKCF